MNLGDLLAWSPLLPLIGGMVIFWTCSSYFWLRLVRVPPALALAASPAITTSLVWALSLLWYQAGWTWSGSTVLPVLAATGVIGALLHLLRRGRPTRSSVRRLAPLVAAGFIGWCLAALPMMLAGKPSNPIQQWDPTFHMNGVWGITQYGIAAPGPGLAHNFGGSLSKEYPIAWHAFTALFATGPTTVLASNASALALMAIWVIGAAAFVYFLYGLTPAAAAAAVIAGVLPSMPADALGAYSQTPNAMSVALMPGVAGLALLVGRRLVRLLRESEHGTWGVWLIQAGALAVALWGGVQAHPVIAFNLTVFLAAPAIVGMVQLVVWAKKNHKPVLLLGTAVAGVAAILVLTAVMLTPEVASMRSYNRSGVGLATAFSQTLIPVPPFPASWGVPLTVGTAVALALTGSVWVARVRGGRATTVKWPGEHAPAAWPIWSYVLFLVLVFFAYGPNWAVRKWFVGPWFSDGRRIMEPMSLALVILAALGFQWLAGLVRSRLGRYGPASLAAALLLLTGFGGLVGRTAAFASVTDPEQLGKPGMASQRVLDMMSALPDLLPEDAVVLGDPKAGAAYSQMLGQRVAYFPQLTLANADRDAQEFLVAHFNEIGSNPEVCEVLKDQGITHFYQAPDGYYYGKLRSERVPGLYQVDTESGFRLIEDAGDARLYEITACD